MYCYNPCGYIYRPCVDYYYVPTQNNCCSCGRSCYPGEGCRIVNYTIYTVNNNQGGFNNNNNNNINIDSFGINNNNNNNNNIFW